MTIFSFRPVPFPNMPKWIELATPPDLPLIAAMFGFGLFFIWINRFITALFFIAGFTAMLRYTYLIPKFSRPAIPTGSI